MTSEPQTAPLRGRASETSLPTLAELADAS